MLRENNLKLSPKKCRLMQGSVKFLVNVISDMPKEALMEKDGCTPSVRRVKSFMGMVLFYQSFISRCSAIAKPLFTLTAGLKRSVRQGWRVRWYVQEADSW